MTDANEVVTNLTKLREAKEFTYVSRHFENTTRGDSLDEYVDLGEKSNDAVQCLYCSAMLQTLAETADHHSTHHPRKRYNSAYYADMLGSDHD